MLSLRTTFLRRSAVISPHIGRVRYESSSPTPGPNEGMGEKKPAANNEDGAIKKRASGVASAVGSAAETVKEAVGGSTKTTDGMGGKEGKAHIKPTDSQNEEEAKKGKAAGGTYRDH